MDVNEPRMSLHKIRIRYWQAKDKKTKSASLAGMQAVTGLPCKSIKDAIIVACLISNKAKFIKENICLNKLRSVHFDWC
jgi:hypothetical protein